MFGVAVCAPLARFKGPVKVITPQTNKGFTSLITPDDFFHAAGKLERASRFPPEKFRSGQSPRKTPPLAAITFSTPIEQPRRTDRTRVKCWR